VVAGVGGVGGVLRPRGCRRCYSGLRVTVSPRSEGEHRTGTEEACPSCAGSCSVIHSGQDEVVAERVFDTYRASNDSTGSAAVPHRITRSQRRLQRVPARAEAGSRGSAVLTADRATRYASAEPCARHDTAERAAPSVVAERAGRYVAAERAGRSATAERAAPSVAAERVASSATAERVASSAAAELASRDVTAEPSAPPATPEQGSTARGVATLDAALAALREVDTDTLGIVELRDHLRALTERGHRLDALRTELTGELLRREVAAAPPGKGHVGSRKATDFLTDELQLSPVDAKRATSTGRQLATALDTRDAFSSGQLSAAHADVITRTLRELPPDRRTEVERTLVSLARTLHPVALGREARRLAAEADQAGAERSARHGHGVWGATWRRTDDGALIVNAWHHGVAADVIETALRAATAKPAADDNRTDDQRRADAFEALCALSLRAGELPAQHGVRPHVIVLVEEDALRRRGGRATLGSGETVPLTEVAPLLDDCAVTRIVRDATGAPLEASVCSRTVSIALYKALLARDGGCTWDRCDRPAVWCQVAHGDDPHGAGGVLAPSNAALLCGYHHRRFDAGGWRMVIRGGRVSYERDASRPPVWSLVAAARAGEATEPARSSPGTTPGRTDDRGRHRTSHGTRIRAEERAGPRPGAAGTDGMSLAAPRSSQLDAETTEAETTDAETTDAEATDAEATDVTGGGTDGSVDIDHTARQVRLAGLDPG
jgi:hypothetical protein